MTEGLQEAAGSCCRRLGFSVSLLFGFLPLGLGKGLYEERKVSELYWALTGPKHVMIEIP
jgi:hypothetical protein